MLGTRSPVLAQAEKALRIKILKILNQSKNNNNKEMQAVQRKAK